MYINERPLEVSRNYIHTLDSPPYSDRDLTLIMKFINLCVRVKSIQLENNNFYTTI